MFNNLLSLLSKDSPLGVILVIFIIATIYLGKLLLAEKDKRIDEAKETEEKVTLVLGDVNNTLKAILINEEKKV